jgi:hypothetical protein
LRQLGIIKFAEFLSSANGVPPINISAAMTMIPRKPKRNCGRNIQIPPTRFPNVHDMAFSISPDLAMQMPSQNAGISGTSGLIASGWVSNIPERMAQDHPVPWLARCVRSAIHRNL